MQDCGSLGRRSRVIGSVGLAVALAGALGCGSSSGGTSSPDAAPPDAGPPLPTRDVDVLFVVENSGSMSEPQGALARSFGRFMDVLKGLPGGVPNLHVAVVSSDMGANPEIPSCTYSGEGTFQASPHAPCTDAMLGGATFISNDDGVPNHGGDLRDVFSCIVRLGVVGCSFEQHLASMARALGADGAGPQPAANQGFLRKDATLAIIVIANEDDCSTIDGASSALFSVGDTNRIDSTYGPVTSFRCNEFGHLCDGQPPSRQAPGGAIDAAVSYEDCVSNEQSAYLRSVASYVDLIRGLKAAPSDRILVAGLVGVPPGKPSASIPYTVYFGPPVTGTAEAPWPAIGTVCQSSNASYASPAIRLNQFVRGFGANGLVFSVCEDDYDPVMATIAEKLSAFINPR